MLAIDIQPGAPTPPAFAKQVRYLDGLGDIVEIHDVTEMFENAVAAGRCGLAQLDRWAKLNYPHAACSFEQLVFWPSEGKWVIATRHNRVQERLAVDAAQARRFERMDRGRDRL
jgi:hypothetical protein